MNKRLRVLRSGMAAFCLLFAGCATTAVIAPVDFAGEAYLKDLCEENGVQWQWDSISQVITLQANGKSAKAMVGSSIVLVEGSKVYLDKPLMTVRSSVIVPPDFKSKVIYAIKKERERPEVPEKAAVGRVREIMIDAGHGGKDPGAIGGSGSHEKDIVLDIAKRLRQELSRSGYKVGMTRTRDEFISLQERTHIASRSKADLFVSVHANASPSRVIYGVEVFSSKDLDYADKTEETRQKNVRSVMRNYRMQKDNVDLDNIIEDMLYAHKQNESRALADELSRATAEYVRTTNRGGKESRFFVLRNTLIPAVLVEVGFLSNPKEEKLLQTSGYRQKIAEGLAKAIANYAKAE